MEKLGINLGYLASQIVNFSLLAILLYILLYKPILRMLDERAARIRKSMEDARTAECRAAEADEEFQKRLAEARREGQEIIAQATRMGEKVREDILAQAREEARRLVERAREEIARERQQAMAELREQTAELAILITQKIIGEALDESAQRRLVREFLTQTGESQ
ncbi:MAG: F0F1 ATP synthase subunit B [Anaerolineae bacterium]